MRNIEKKIEIEIDGEKKVFRLRKPDAFTGVEILRLLLRLQDQSPDKVSVLDLIMSLSAQETREIMKSSLNHVDIMLPAGPNPVMTGDEWTWEELRHDADICMHLLLEEVAWALEGFFGAGGPTQEPASANSSRPNA